MEILITGIVLATLVAVILEPIIGIIETYKDR